MRTFSAIYRGNGLLELRDNVQLEEDSEVLVVVPEEAEAEDGAWSKLALEQFLSGYSEADSTYNNL